jgi:16S rRNA G966 N2-methylase RsmD
MLQPNEIEFIATNGHRSPSDIALDARKFPELDIKKLAHQIQARQKLTEKLPLWVANRQIYFPASISLEQSSSESTASFKASLVSGRLIDITGGMGVDAWAFAQTCSQVTYVEMQEELAAITQYNHAVLGVTNITHYASNGLDILNQVDVDWIYADPARRNEHGEKVILFKDCQPNVLDVIAQHPDKKMLIKTSPVLDISRAIQELGGVSQVYVVCSKQEVKELLFVKQGSPTMDPLITIVEDGRTIFEGTQAKERLVENTIGPVKHYVYEAHPGILKAGFFKSVLQANMVQLGDHTHLYSSDEFVGEFPGKIFEVIESGPVQGNWLPVKQANISTRNFPMSPEALRKKLKLKDGGEFTLFGIQNSSKKNELILSKKITFAHSN